MTHKNTFLLFAFLIFLGACSTKNNSTNQDKKDSINATTNEELDKEEIEEEVVAFNPDLFPLLEEDSICFESKIYDDEESIPYELLEDSLAEPFFKGSFFFDQAEWVRIIGQITLTKRFGLFIVAFEDDYDDWLELYARVFDYDQNKFIDEISIITSQNHDKIQEKTYAVKSWFVDVNEDGIPEFIQRSSNIILEKDTPGSAVDIVSHELNLYEFDTIKGIYETSTNRILQKQLEPNYTITLDELMD